MTKHFAGGGLHRSGKGSTPYCGTDSETGMRVAKLVPKDRTTGGSCGSEGKTCEGLDPSRRARPVHQRQIKGYLEHRLSKSKAKGKNEN